MLNEKNPFGGTGNTKNSSHDHTNFSHSGKGLDVEKVRQASQGKAHEILVTLGVNPKVLDGKPGHPCPHCGGDDRFHLTDNHGSGSYVCRKCGGGNDIFSLVGKIMGLDPKRDFPQILEIVAGVVGVVTECGPANDTGNTFPPKEKTKPQWQSITPVPDDAPEPPTNHYKHGTPSKIWTYRDAEGRTLFHVCRFDSLDGKKQILPLSFCQDLSGKREWRWQGLPSPRPLYGLDRLAARPDAQVLICEGEKAADAAGKMFPDCVAVTSPNGAGGASFADWSPLDGRRVTVWRDNDEPGLEYASQAIIELHKVGVASVSVVAIPDSFPVRWDLADDLPEGINAEDLLEMLRTAKPAETANDESQPANDDDRSQRHFPFKVVEGTKGKRAGVYYLPASDGDEQPAPVWICSPVYITARTRDDTQNNHGRLLEFRDPDGHHHTWAMSLSLLAGDGTELRAILLSKGAEISPMRKARDKLPEYLQSSRPDAVARCVDRTGWHGGAFVFPDATLTGWQAGEANHAAKACFESWIVNRGGTGPKEIETALSQVRLFFEQHGESRFAPKNSNNDRPTINRAGFREDVVGHTEWWVLPEVFRSEICQGLDHRFVTKLLVERGWICPESDRKVAVKPRLPGMGPTRCYHFVSVGGSDEN